MWIAYWVAVALVVYCYVGYPLLIAMAARLWGRPVRKAAIEPSVSVLMAVWNEQEVLAAKMRNLLDLDYPADKLEILVGSDASTDGTREILMAVRDPRVRFVEFSIRRGKPSVLDDLAAQARHEILLFTDARQRLARGALRALVRNFADREVGCASGELVFEKPQTATGKGVDLYWRYEKFMRDREARLHSSLGATGALYAIRRELFCPLPPTTLLDDMYVPLRIIEQGYRVVFDTASQATDQVAENPREEYRRKIRTLCGNYQLFAMLPQMFVPLRSPIAWQLFSHKLLRVLVPFFLLFVFAATWWQPTPIRWGLGFAQLSFYGMACVWAILRETGKTTRMRWLSRLCSVPYMFCVLNVAALAGFGRFVTSRQRVAWDKARAVSEPVRSQTQGGLAPEPQAPPPFGD